MDALALAARMAVVAAEQAAGRVAAAAATAEAAAGRVQAAAETASAPRTIGMAPVVGGTYSPAPASSMAQLVARPPPFEAASVTKGACAYCNEGPPLFESVFGGRVCGFHQAMTLSLLDDTSTNGASGVTGDYSSAGAEVCVIAGEGYARTPSSDCVLQCGNRVAGPRSGSRCASGHALCADCTAQYIGKTLQPGIVWWDRVNCVDPECTEHMEGMSIQRCISRELVNRIDAAQLELVPSLGPEARRERERAAEAEAARRESELRKEAVRLEGIGASETAVARLGARPCPNCGTDIMKNGGCPNMHCTRCGHDFRWP